MNCAEARKLLDSGVRPGSTNPERARLGFHLSGCATCREYQAQLQDDFLANLLAQEAEQPPFVVAPSVLVPSAPQELPSRSLRSRFGHALWITSLALFAVFILTIGSIAGWAALSVFNIHRNVQAMIVATSTEAPTAEPTMTPVPTAAPLPSQTPDPTNTPIPTNTPTPTAPPPTPTPAVPPAGDPVTVLILGNDRRPGESGAPRTDAIIVARIDPQRHRIALLSLPRDLWVDIPGYGQSRINAAHVWGVIYGDPEGGTGLARRTVSNLLGIPIDYTIMVDFEGFIGAIDAIGGVDVDVTKELYDDAFPTMDYGYTIAHFLPGRQHMDGATALMYSRIRHPDSDFERMSRQQAVLAGILDTLRNQNVLENIQSLEQMTTALRGFVQTDIPEERMIGLAWALRNTNGGQIERYRLDGSMLSFGVGADQYAEVALPGTLETLAQLLLGQ